MKTTTLLFCAAATLPAGFIHSSPLLSTAGMSSSQVPPEPPKPFIPVRATLNRDQRWESIGKKSKSGKGRHLHIS